jgi:hypothetical protein
MPKKPTEKQKVRQATRKGDGSYKKFHRCELCRKPTGAVYYSDRRCDHGWHGVGLVLCVTCCKFLDTQDAEAGYFKLTGQHLNLPRLSHNGGRYKQVTPPYYMAHAGRWGSGSWERLVLNPETQTSRWLPVPFTMSTRALIADLDRTLEWVQFMDADSGISETL